MQRWKDGFVSPKWDVCLLFVSIDIQHLRWSTILYIDHQIELMHANGNQSTSIYDGNHLEYWLEMHSIQFGFQFMGWTCRNPIAHIVVWWHYGGLKIFWKPCSVCLDGKKSSSKPKKRILMRWNVFVRFFGTYLPLGGAGGLEEDWSCLTMIFSPNSPIEYWWDHALKHLHYCGSPIRESVKSTWANRSTS